MSLNVCVVCDGESGRPYKAKGMCARCYNRQWVAENHDRVLASQRAFRERHPGYATNAVRVYRSDPEKAELDRERSRRWKAENRERTRAYDRERRRKLREAA